MIDTPFVNADSLTVLYSTLPLELQSTYSRRSVVLKNDTLGRKKQFAVSTQSEGVFTNIFGPELSKNGSISRGFLVGSNRDLSLSSGFRLQMAGKLSSDIEILAALTDENTPLQPQGNTQTLQEIDNVFVEIKSPVYTATLGDFLFNSRSGEFVNVNRKLQGAKLRAEYQQISPGLNIQVTGATSRGKFNSNAFQGIEGVQGPYRLTGKNNERAIIIIAGSEKVFVDGEVMIRGDNNDYSVEYGSAEVTFSTRRLITGASRIVVDFEYSDRQFTRNFAGIDAQSKLSEHVSLQTTYFREGDDPDAPIDITLNESDRTILRNAGNSIPSRSGVVYVGTDSIGIGRGNYSAVDTVINGSSIRFYRFEQNTPAAVFSVSFSPVGQGNGEYRREGIGRYTYVGIAAGQYSPIVILPRAQLHQLFSLQTTVLPMQSLTVQGEYAASNFDQNRLSSIGDQTNSGGAVRLSARFNPKSIVVAGHDIGSIDVTIMERFKQQRFLTLDRTDAVEFGRKWSTDSLSQSGVSDEEIREGKISYMPIDDLVLTTGIGTLNRYRQFSSQRYDAMFELNNKQYPAISYSFENISGTEKILRLSNTWIRQKGTAEYHYRSMIPSFRYEQEHRTVRDDRTDSLTLSSYAYTAAVPKVAFNNVYGMDLSGEYEWRNDDAVDQGQLQKQSSSRTQHYAVVIHEIQNFSLSSILALREKSYEKTFQTNNVNQRSTLIKVQSRYRPYSQGIDIDLFYDAASQRTAKLERFFYKVRPGEGQYIWKDANTNGIIDVNDEREFQPDRYDGDYIALTLNSENLIPIVNLKSSARLRITPSKFISASDGTAETMLSYFSTETFFRLEERSTESNTEKIYLLNIGSFLNPKTTQLGYQFFQQDLFLFEYQPDFSLRFRFNQRKGLNQFSSGTENNYAREQSVRSRFQISNEIANQTDIVFKNDNAVSSSVINPSRQIAYSSLASDFSYRPESNIEVGLVLETSEAEDHAGGTPVIADFNGQTMRFVYGFLGNGQLRAEISREEVVIGFQPVSYRVPYELTSGRDFGKNFLWSISSEYRLSGNVQFSLQYSGRTTPRSDVVHTGRMEVRAFF